MSTLTSPEPTLEKPASDAFAQWRQAVEAELKGASFEKKLITRTPEGIALQPLYVEANALPAACSLPGVPPFTRGDRKDGYAVAGWIISQGTSASTPAEFNAVALRALARDAAIPALRLDRGGRLGLDPDELIECSDGDGLIIGDIADLRVAFAKIALAGVPLQIEAGVSPLPLAGIFLSYTREKRASWKKLKGALTADPLAEWTVRGGLPVTLEALYEDLAGWTLWAEKCAPELKTIGVSGVHWHEAGGNAVQELALTLATGTEYLRELCKRGVAPADATARMRFQFAIGGNFFMELSKFRAFRSLWSRVLKGFDVDPAKAGSEIFAATARWNQTRLDPHVNLLRATTGALSAILGGVTGLRIDPFDAVTDGGGEFSQRIADNIHTLLAEEFRLTSPADPSGGSWYVESLTEQLARNAWTLFQEIERSGGLVKAFENGLPQKWIAASAGDKRDAVNKRRSGIVGTNLFPNLKERAFEAPSNNAMEVRKLRGAALAARRQRAKKTALPARWPARLSDAMDAAKTGTTLGQLMIRAYGAAPAGAPQVAPVQSWRAAEGFEALRVASDAFAARTGKRPQVFLAKMGPAAQHKARADFASGFFATGGFETIGKQNFETAESAALAAVASGARIAVICSTDETYPSLAPVFARAVKTVAPSMILVLAGYPTEHIEAFKTAGIDEFIHIRADVRGVLEKLLLQTDAVLPNA
jgi:methylmalonyl-CoA mutase